MMKAIKNFMNKPWTWGTYFKFCGICRMGKVEREKGIERDAREQSGRVRNLKDHALLSF